MFADETAWVRAVEAYWRRETGERVLKVVELDPGFRTIG